MVNGEFLLTTAECYSNAEVSHGASDDYTYNRAEVQTKVGPKRYATIDTETQGRGGGGGSPMLEFSGPSGARGEIHVCRTTTKRVDWRKRVRN